MAIMWIGDKIGWVLGTIIAVFIMVHWGWRAVFISFGLVGLIVAPLYYWVLRTHPQDSRFVNKAELEYITGGQAAVAEKKQMPPWGDFLRSSQFWAIGGQFVTVDFVNYVFIAWVPVYLLEAHHFSLKQMGFVAALPEVGFAVGQIVCGSIADYLIGRRITTSNVRAWIGGLALLSCCGCLYFTAMAEDRWITVAWLTFANTCLGVGSNCAWTTCTEIGGKFAGTVTGWMNFWGNAIGGVSPLIIAWFVMHYGWRAAILVTAASGISGTILWIFVRPNSPIRHRYSEPAQAAVVAAK